MANDDTTVDPQLEDARERRRESDPVIAHTEARLRAVVAPIPRRTPTGTPSIPVSPSAVPLRDPAQALPNATMMGLPRANTVRAIPSIVRSATTPPLPRAPTADANPFAKTVFAQPAVESSRASTAPADGDAPQRRHQSPAFERAVTAPANYPARTQSGSPTMMATQQSGANPIVEQPVVARTITHSTAAGSQPPPFSGSQTVMGTRAGTGSGEQPVVARTITQSGSPSRAPTAVMGTRAATTDAQPVVPRSIVEQPVVSRTQSGSQTVMGTRATSNTPVIGHAPTASGANPIVIPSVDQPAISRTQSGSQTMMGTRAATTGAQPLVPRTTTASGANPVVARAQPTAPRARGTTVIPVPPIAIPVASSRAPASVSAERPAPLFATPPAPLAAPMVSVAEPMVASAERSGPLFATPPQPLPVSASPFPNPVLPIPAPVISYEPPSTPIVAAPMLSMSSGVMRVPTMIDTSATHSSQPVAARMAAALPAPRPIVSPMVVPRPTELPPYIPAPNLGDPGEGVATVRVEKIEFTELVEKYAPLPVAPVPELAEVPRAFDARKLGKTVLRFAPLIGGVALLMVFVIGYFMFDGDGRKGPPMTNVRAPIVIKSVAPAAAPAPAASAGTTDAAKSDAKADDAKADDAKPDDAKPDDAKPDDAKTDVKANDTATKADAVPKADVKSATGAPNTADVKPTITEDKLKPARGKIYITSNKPAQIFLDGKSANATTPRQLTVRPGWHKITLWETASGKTVTQQIEVAADKVVTINKKFE